MQKCKRVILGWGGRWEVGRVASVLCQKAVKNGKEIVELVRSSQVANDPLFELLVGQHSRFLLVAIVEHLVTKPVRNQCTNLVKRKVLTQSNICLCSQKHVIWQSIVTSHRKIF